MTIFASKIYLQAGISVEGQNYPPVVLVNFIPIRYLASNTDIRIVLSIHTNYDPSLIIT